MTTPQLMIVIAISIQLLSFPTGSFLSSTSGGPVPKLLHKFKTLASCQYDSDCVENAYCWSQQSCLCKDGYLVDRNRTHARCLAVATQFGDPCSVDVQCRVTFAAQAECRNGSCGCCKGAHFQDGRCYETKRIGEICRVSNNCHVEGSSSYCVAGICTCPFQHHPNENGTRCVRSSILGDECLDDEECVVRNSRCQNVCRCRIDHVISKDEKRCLKVANSVGESCELDSQCEAFIKNSFCKDGSCVCLPHSHQRGQLCVENILLNEPCTDHRQCVTLTHKNSNSTEITSVDCVDGICTCTPDYIMTEDSLDCIRYSENAASRISMISSFLPTIFILVRFISTHFSITFH